MKLLRSWPTTVPAGRSYVVDDIPKLVMDGYDYRCLRHVDDDLVLIEWDIAAGGEQLETFMARAAAAPNQVRVAPYLLYPASTRAQHPFYVHSVRGPGAKRYVTGPDDEWCHMAGFGLIYLPRDLVLGFLDNLTLPQNRHRKFSDTTFSYWHWRHVDRNRRQIPIDWDCHAVHLHYDLPAVPEVQR